MQFGLVDRKEVVLRYYCKVTISKITYRAAHSIEPPAESRPTPAPAPAPHHNADTHIFVAVIVVLGVGGICIVLIWRSQVGTWQAVVTHHVRV